jgi:YesN/AraC family two-component response regulator
MYQLIIIDDEEKICEGTTHIFPWDNVGFQVAAAFTNAAAALEYMENHPVHVILTDIRMPAFSGIDLAKHIGIYYPSIKIVFMSGYSDFEYLKSAIIHSVCDYLLKPIKYDELLTCFQRLYEQLNQENQIQETEKHHSYYSNIITTSIEYINTHIRDASLEAIAIKVNMSPCYLSRIIKEKSGKNFSTYLLEARMKKAAELLSGIEYKHYEIAFQVGYDNPKNFSRAFKQYYGMSPKEYREQENI